MAKRLSQVEFIEKCKDIHGDQFDYSKTVYKNCRSKIIITCKKHGDIHIRSSNHLHMSQGCFECFLDKHRLTELSQDRLDNLKKIHNNRYIYNDISVDRGRINITCSYHGIYNQYLYFHEYGHGCPQCNSSSRGENKIKDFLENKGIVYQRNYCFDDCVRKKKLRFDFYLSDLNIIVEYDGEHHFQENKYFGDGNLEYIKHNDKIKNNYCKKNGIKLIRIPYYSFDNIDLILSEEL